MADVNDNAIYDEKEVPEYDLPPLILKDELKNIDSKVLWWQQRRKEIINTFANEVYGKTPEDEVEMTAEIQDINENILAGKAVRKQIKITLTKDKNDVCLYLLLYLPAEATESIPVFLGLNFDGNHTLQDDPDLIISDNIKKSEAAERGSKSSRWPVEMIIDKGCGLATVYRGDVAPDHKELWREGVWSLFTDQDKERQDSEWGAIGCWAWGLSRCFDFLAEQKEIDQQKIVVIGHSRLGKAALWAGAQDKRFALAISNNSGCGGAALSRRRFGETVAKINKQFPHWFCKNFRKYNDNEDLLPVDQHMLLALIAPRPLYVASATEDLWADPRGEFLATREASQIYQLLGKEGLLIEEMPAPEKPVADGYVGYHLREGGHGLTAYDWQQYLEFVDEHLDV